MVVVDSSVWIDYYRDAATPETEMLDRLLIARKIKLGDLIAIEVLQGVTRERDRQAVLLLFDALPHLTIGGMSVAIEGARNYQRLRELGVTVRKTIDTLIATRCIRDDLALLYRDRDFDPFVEHLGLRSAMA